MYTKLKDLSIQNAIEISNLILEKWGFVTREANFITKNIIAAEISGKSTHGLTRLQFIRKFLLERINLKGKYSYISESDSHIYIDAKNKLGFQPIYESLQKAYKKLSSSAVVTIGIKDCLFSGYVGDYAYEATQQGFIYLGFHNSTATLIPHGAKEPLWGTNPITVGIPGKKHPIIYDAAMSQISGGQVLLSQKNNNKLPENVAMDKNGNFTTNPFTSIGLVSFGHKGSGLAYIVELLAGALTASKVGKKIEGGWGSFAILINPTFFRLLTEFSKDVDISQQELKNAQKRNGVKNIYFPGEQSLQHRYISKKNNTITIPFAVYKELIEFKKENYA